MKKVFGLAALALAMTASASATTIVVFCGGFSASNSGSPITTPTSGTLTCGALGSSLTTGNTGFTQQLIWQSDYSSGFSGANAATTIWTPPSPFLTDAPNGNVASGNGGSNTYTDGSASVVSPTTIPEFTNTGVPLGNFTVTPTYLAYFLASGSQAGTGAISVNYSDTVSGNIQTVSGNLYELVTYSAAQTGTPEPTSFILMGAGLGVLGLLRRRVVRR